VPIKLETDLIP